MSAQHRIGDIAIVLLGVLLAAGCARTPATSSVDFSLVPESDLERAGREFGNAYARRFGLIESHQVSALVRRIGRKVAASSHEPERHFTFEIIDRQSPNASALPDGTIFVTRGMLALVNNVDELAWLLGHEIAHVTARHQRASMTRASLLKGASLLGTPLLAGAGLGSLLVAAVQPAYSRDQEREADTLGRDYAVAAGFDPACGAELLRSLYRLRTLDPNAPDVNARSATHPAPLERYADLRAEGTGGTCEGDYVERVVGLEMPDVFRTRDGATWVPLLALRVEAGPPDEKLEIHSDRKLTVARVEGFPSPIELRRFDEGEGIDHARNMARRWPQSGGRNGPRRLLYDESPYGEHAGVRLAIWEAVRGKARVGCYRWVVLDGRLYRARAEVPEEGWQTASDALDVLVGRLRPAAAGNVPRVDATVVAAGDSLADLSRRLEVWSAAELAVYNGLDVDAQPEAGRRLKVLSLPNSQGGCMLASCSQGP